MLCWLRRRYVSYLLVAAVLLTVWLAAGKIVLGSNRGGERFARDLPAATHLLKDCPEEKRRPEDNREGGSGRALLSDEGKPKDRREGENDRASLSEDGPESGRTDAESVDAAGLKLPEERALPEPPTEPPGPSLLNTESALPVGECLQQDAAPALPAPVELSANTPTSSLSTQAALPPYSLGKPHHRRFRIRVRIENSGDMESQNIRLQIPVLGRLNSPYQVVESEIFSLEPVEITAGDYNSRSAHFFISGLPPGESVCVNITYELKAYPITVNFSAYAGGSNSPAEAVFLQPAASIESSHPEITSKAEQITSGAKDDLEKARAIYQFVRQHMRYDSNAACRNQGALTALREKVGVCEDYAALFVALCRAVNIPARQVNGYADPKGTGQRWDQLNQPFPLKGYRHSWAEFYLEGAGWLPVDPTMNITAQDFKYFGCLPCSSHIAQNYFDQSVRIRFQGGRLGAVWEEELI